MALASRLGQTVIARLHLPVHPLDPWAWWAPLAADPRCGRVTGAWAGPDGETVLLGVGTAAADDAGLSTSCSRRFERWVDSRPEVPAALAGFAFSGATGGWGGFGAGWVVVPKLMVWRRGAEAGCAVALAVAPGDARDRLEAQVQEARAMIAGIATIPEPTSCSRPVEQADPGARAAWIDLVTRARDEVASGRLAKLVVARRRTFALEKGARWDVRGTAMTLRREDPHSQVFALASPDDRWWIGASPELLAAVDGREARTVALAGTRPRGESAEIDAEMAAALTASAKDREEHRIVVEAIRARLGRLAKKVEIPTEPRVVRFKRVMHLETPIAAQLAEGAGILDVARALHPTPAVAGAPVDAAMRWLEREEDLERGWYAGPVGWIDAQGGGRIAVALRSARLDAEMAHAYAGAGIVAASVPSDEWDETEHKLAAIEGALIGATR